MQEFLISWRRDEVQNLGVVGGNPEFVGPGEACFQWQRTEKSRQWHSYAQQVCQAW